MNENTPTISPHQSLVLAGDVLELGAQWSIAVNEWDSFERYMAQLKVYYFDFQ